MVAIETYEYSSDHIILIKMMDIKKNRSCFKVRNLIFEHSYMDGRNRMAKNEILHLKSGQGYSLKKFFNDQ